MYKIVIYAEPRDDSATAEEIKDFCQDLSWVGGCRDPGSDPMFSSLELHDVTVKELQRTPRKLKGDA